MDAKRRPPPIPEKTVAGMPPAKPPVPGPLPTPPTQLESQVGRLEVEGEAADQVPSNAEGGEHQGDGGANERFDPPVGGQFTSPAVAIMDPMKKQARRKTNLPPGYPNQQQSSIPPGASPSQVPALSSGYVGKGASAAPSNGVQASSDTIQQAQPTASQQPSHRHLRSPSVKRAPGSTVTMQGWLHKQGSDGLMLWKRRWFVLSEFCLFYYKGPEEEKVLGSILLPSYVISPCSSDEPKRGGHRKHSFKAEHHNMRTYYFAAESSDSMERWMYNMNLASLLQRDFTTGAVSEGTSWDERQSGRPSVSSISSLLNQSADDSDSGFHGGRSPKHATIAVGSSNPSQSATVPAWASKGKKLEEETISEVSRERDAVTTYRKGTETTPDVPSLPAEFQPLYANAPPKPRRLNSAGRDYSTSPERSPERKGEEESVVLRSRGPVNEPQQNGMYLDRNQRISRPMVSYASIRHERNSSYQQQTMQVQHPAGISAPNQMVFPVTDRRTPDTYGRSNTGDSSAAVISKMVPNRVDYEDVYSVSHSSEPMVGRMNRWSSGPYDTQHLYPNEVHQNVIQQQSPHVHLCPPSGHSPQQGHQQHTHSTQLGMVQRMPIVHPYTVSPTTAQHHHPPIAQQHLNQQLLPPQPQPQVFHRRTPPLPRPHSADFLGHYDHNQMSYVMPLPASLGSGTSSVEQPSPKIPPGAIEDVQKQYPNAQTVDAREKHAIDVISAQQIQRPKSSMDIRPVSQTISFDPTDYWSEESYARMMRQSLYMHAHHVHPSSSSSHKGSETSSGMGHQLQNWSAYGQESSPGAAHQNSSRLPQTSQKQQHSEPVELRNKGAEDATAPVPQRQSAPPGKRDMNQGGHFLRSASARMPRSRYHSGDNLREQPTALSAVPGEEARNGERKMQQREESMRRLLEWKQRMLQSPLTRKSSSSSAPRRQSQDSTPHNSSQMSSSHYKQMVLKQLANQEAAASTNSWEHSSRRGGSRRGPDDVRSARSRSHDGRRSSASLSRYNSYSSDDEASGSGSIREPAPVRHPKNDPSSTMLVISQPTSIPIQSPTYVQPPNARLGVPHLKHHSVQPHEADGEGEADGKGRQWRGNEGMVGQAVPMLRWEREGVQPLRKPEDLATSERDFHSMQRNATSPKHDVSNGGGGRGRKGRESGKAEKAGERRRGDGGRGEVSVSAGDLLGRTHEELVLLLIQLRRQSAAVSNAIDLCQADLSAQARLAELEMHRRVEHLKKLEELKKHLLELEKQYEKGKPLINLVDNMVKLGSLYRGNTDAQGRIRGWRGTGGEASTGPSPAKDRLQFNQRVQEQRLLAEERRDWSRLSPDHGELQAKVQQLYRLDRLLQEESVTIQSLQQDKELLEKALGGLRHKLQGSGVPSIGNVSGSSPRDSSNTKGAVGNTSMVDPAEAERYRKQQRMLERELSRVRQLLAQNSKKLEETVAENARLEQELVVLRQKLQLSRRTLDTHPTSQSPGSNVTNPASPGGATASLEAELRRVQSAVGDLQRQRHELSVQVRQLTEKSHSLVEQIRPGPTGVAGAGPIPAKKRHHSTWMETDLDSMESMDCGIESPGPGPSPSRGAPMLQPMVHSPPESTPLYVNTTLGQHVERDDVGRRPAGEDQQSMANGYELTEGETGEEAQGYQAMDINEADDRMKRFYGIIPREKPEIKTVRIVKRESERRHRDRSSKRVVLVDDPCENSCAASSSSLNRVLEEEVVEGEEEEEAMAYHAHHQQQSQQLHNMSSSVPFSPAFLGPPEDDPILSQFFQRSLSLPRALGKQRGQPPPVPPPPPLRVASPRGSSAAVRRQQLRLRSDVSERPRSAHEQLFGTSQEEPPCLQQPSLSYSVLPSYSSSPSSHSGSPTLFSPTDRAYPPLPPTPDSPPPITYKSEAAREIAMEMAALHSGEDWAGGNRGSVKKRATPKEKRRHYTVSCSRPLELESIVLPKMGSARSRDDLDMEQVLRPRLNAPDVVRSTMSHRDFKYNEHTIDSVLGTPNKIVIPERYIPEQAPELSEEEQMHRLKKAEAIRKMLSETTPISAPEVEENQQKKTSTIKKKVAEEKRQRDHILQLNQILAKQVMEKSKMVAGTTPVAAFGTQD